MTRFERFAATAFGLGYGSWQSTSFGPVAPILKPRQPSIGLSWGLARCLAWPSSSPSHRE
jgi:hypothetical protein